MILWLTTTNVLAHCTTRFFLASFAIIICLFFGEWPAAIFMMLYAPNGFNRSNHHHLCFCSLWLLPLFLHRPHSVTWVGIRVFTIFQIEWNILNQFSEIAQKSTFLFSSLSFFITENSIMKKSTYIHLNKIKWLDPEFEPHSNHWQWEKQVILENSKHPIGIV